jgi:GntR family transcriptional regulator
MDRLPVKLSDATGVPYYRQIVDQVAQAIRSGQLPPTTRLPSVRELAAQLLVSLITIRRAYADLEAAGLITRRQGQGTFVADQVAIASREQVQAEARALIVDAVAHVQRLGLDSGDVRELFHDVIAQKGEEHGHA